jgi:glutamate dehydrogenase
MFDEDVTKRDLLRDAVSGPGSGDAPRAFAEALFAHASSEDLVLYGADEIARLIAGAYAHLNRRMPGTVSIRVETPAAPRESRLSAVTVVEILNDDMPFLVDSVMSELSEQGLDIRLVAHPIVTVSRDGHGGLIAFEGTEPPPPKSDAIRESLIHIHVDRVDGPEAVAALKAGLERTLGDVRLVVADWRPMLKEVDATIHQLKHVPPPIPVAELSEAIEFMSWLRDNNFTFLGLRRYEVVGKGQRMKLEPVDATGLGVLRDPSVGLLRRGRQPVTMTPELRDFLAQPRPLIVTKANLRSRVHRRIHMDYVGVKLFDGKGHLTGELRVAGLFTSTAYTRSTRAIPYIRRKVEAVMARSGFATDSHSGKALVNVLETYPRDELFQIDDDVLAEHVGRIMMLDERPRVRVLPRPDKFGRFVSVLVYLPRERYTTTTRVKIGEMLAASYAGRLATWSAAYPEGPLARLHFIVARGEEDAGPPDVARLEEATAAIVRTWGDAFVEALGRRHERPKAQALRARYQDAFSAAYQERYAPETAVEDARTIEKLSDERRIAIDFTPFEGAARHEIGLKVFHRGGPIPLSTRVPILEDMGFRAISETSVEITPAGGDDEAVVLHDIRLARADGLATDFESADTRIEAAFMAVWAGHAESDGYAALVLKAGLGWREVALVRAMSRYLRQARIPYSQDYMWATLVRHSGIAADLVALFHARFDPGLGLDRAARETRAATILANIEAALATVTSLDEDRIVRRFVNLTQSMLRTNFYQIGKDGFPKPTIAFKLDSKRVEGLPNPRPMVEISVYSPRVEGVHLRFGRIARGGLRWSDRPQDFRTEVLGLVKAQQVKNAVIVPVGAKGGFVPKMLPPASDRAAWLAEGTEAYKLFVASLLDVTDNIDASGATVVRDNLVRWDGDDPYLVVAADKGTATFSDTANGISAAYDHWLGDAFASGGSAGYDHKKMGITARGGWEAVKRHFRERDLDIQTTPFTAMGVGDMSGDVFGNGMLLSEKIRLIAAFDHRDIFIDPDPDMAKSFAERARMFALPRSSWADYDKGLISAGGGVFSRSAKSIALSAQARAAIGLAKETATPAEVMNAILRAKVDLLWFGGIGTYVRATSESDEEVGDRANDAIRVTAADLGASVIGEGANLGMTQRARIEAAQRGVRLNTDAIDNSAGVNSSDVEVNFKIALGQPMRAGRLSLKARNALLAEMTPDVAAVVLRNNYLQSLAISLAERRGAEDLGFARRMMQTMEAEGRLDRKVEYLPEERDLDARAKRGEGLTRPEVAVLLAYAKLSLYEEILESGVPDDAYLGRELQRYFPPALTAKFGKAVETHRLRREIIATALVNSIVNRGGPTIVTRIVDQTGVSAPEIAAAFAATRDTFGMTTLNGAIDGLDARISGGLQLDLYAGIQEVLLDRVVWFLRNGGLSAGLTKVVRRFGAAVSEVADALDRVLPAHEVAELSVKRADLAAKGVPEDLARRLVDLPVLALAPDALLVADETRSNVVDAARAFFAVADLFELRAIGARARGVAVTGYYERLALDRALSDLAGANRRIAVAAVKAGGMEAWLTHAGGTAKRTKAQLSDIAGAGDMTVAKLAVAAGLLGDLAGA